MRQRRARSDDVLFISALAAVLLGIGLLLLTTGSYSGALHVWPLLVLAVGGALLYFALVRGYSSYFLFGGILFVLVGILFIAGALSGWTLMIGWPLGMIAAGASGLVTSLVRWRRFRPAIAAPSVGFVLLGILFSLFSFRLVTVGLGRVVAAWWPSLLIAGGLSLFVAYGLSVRGIGSQRPRRRAASRKGSGCDEPADSAGPDAAGRGRDPDSGK